MSWRQAGRKYRELEPYRKNRKREPRKSVHVWSKTEIAWVFRLGPPPLLWKNELKHVQPINSLGPIELRPKLTKYQKADPNPWPVDHSQSKLPLPPAPSHRPPQPQAVVRCSDAYLSPSRLYTPPPLPVACRPPLSLCLFPLVCETIALLQIVLLLKSSPHVSLSFKCVG
jgi:hypothetical protein